MMSYSKKTQIITKAIVFALFFLLIPSISRAYDFTVNGIYYNLKGDEAVVTYPNTEAPTKTNPSSYTGAVSIPAVVTYDNKSYAVVGIGEKAFLYSSINSISLPESIVGIEKQALCGCGQLTTLSLPNSLQSIGFVGIAYNSGITSITLGNNITKLEQGAFYSTNIEEMYVNATTPPKIASYLVSTKPEIFVKINSLEAYESSPWASFGSLSTFEDADYTYNDLQDIISIYAQTDYPLGNMPGMLSPSSVETFNESIAKARSLPSTTDAVEIKKAIKELFANVPKPIALTTGYYRIVSAGNGTGFNGGPYNYENKVCWYNEGGLVRWEVNEPNNYEQIYKVSPSGDNWKVFSLADNSFVRKGLESYGCDVSTSATECPQVFTHIGNGKYIIQAEGMPYVYAMTNGHNGSSEESGTLNVWGTPNEAEEYGINVWYLSPVPEEIVNYLKQHYKKEPYTIGESPVEPVEGKKYVVRNSSTKDYLTSSGALTAEVTPTKEYFWQIEASGNEVDSYPTYLVKSVALDSYWKHIDFSKQLWSDNTPYDAYDWYNYAGLNAEFGTRADAMEVTILKASSTNSWRAKDAPDGYVLAMKEPVVTSQGTYYYKLGAQNKDVGMEPWNENVGWDFYPVSETGTRSQDLQNAIDTYGQLDVNVNTSYDPGFYNPDKMEAYITALNTIKSFTGEESNTAINNIISNLKTAYEDARQPNPITEGYYYIVTAGNGSGYSGGPYNYELKSALYNGDEYVMWKDFDPNDFNQIYYFSPSSDGNWEVRSALNQTYIGKGQSQYSTKVSTTPASTTSQIFNFVADGKFSFHFNGNPYVYAVAPSHNGSNAASGYLNIWGTPGEAKKYGVNQWYIKSVDESVIEQFSKTDIGLLSLCSQFETIANNLETGTAPGYYINTNVAALKQTIADTRSKITASATPEEKAILQKSLYDARDKAFETLPITDGYYYLVNNFTSYNKYYGNYPSIFTATKFQLNETESACYYDMFTEGNANYIYKVSKDEDSDLFRIQNAYTGWYLNTGYGNGAAGEILTCTQDFVTPQIFTWASAGKYWIADTSDSIVSHAIGNAANVNKRDFIIGDSKSNASISDNMAGYNTWSLISLTEQDALHLINAQKEQDKLSADAFNSLVAYNDSIEMRYNSIVNSPNGVYNASAVINLRSKKEVVARCISTRPYDITSNASDYNQAKSNLQEAIENALTSKPDPTNYQLAGTPFGSVSVDYSQNTQSTTVNTPAEVFDNNYNTFYAAYEHSTGYVALDLGEKHIIKRVAYAPRINYANRLILGVFEGANKSDFSDAIPFYVIKDAPEYNNMTYADVDCSRGFRYVRYVGPDDMRCNIAEIQFYGTVGEGDDSHLYQLTNLPLVVIRTDANISEISSRTTWLPGHINIISQDGNALKTDTMRIRGRGNGSWTFEKKPYKFKLGNKARVLGMPAKAKTWTLINNYGDKSLIRNNVAFKISEIFEMAYTPACTLVDVIFNGQYKGSYQLCDQVEVHKNRVEVTPMDSDDNSGDSITGGYLIELDAYAGSEPKNFSSNTYGIPVTVHYPEPEDITDQQFQYIQTAFNDVCQRVYSTEYKDSIQGYSAVLDQDSWLKYFLIEELSGNTDGYWSTFLTKDRNGKFVTSPAWDFDLGFDNDGRTHPILTMTDFLSLSSRSSAANGVRNFNRKIVESCSKELKEIWSWYRYRGGLTYENLKATVDSLGAENELSAEYNYIRWPILNICTQQQYTTRGSYKAEVDFISEYLYDRIAWLDNKVGLEEPIGIHNTTTDEAVGGIHGHNDHISIRGFAEGSLATIYTLNGAIVASRQISEFDNKIELPKGLYVVKVTDKSGKSLTKKVAVN